jgi:hypothetical protein
MLEIAHWQITALIVVDCLEVEFLLCSFCHLVIISFKYILNSEDKREQPCHTPLLISASFDNLELNFVNILFCVLCPRIAFNNIYLE